MPPPTSSCIYWEEDWYCGKYFCQCSTLYKDIIWHATMVETPTMIAVRSGICFVHSNCQVDNCLSVSECYKGLKVQMMNTVYDKHGVYFAGQWVKGGMSDGRPYWLTILTGTILVFTLWILYLLVALYYCKSKNRARKKNWVSKWKAEQNDNQIYSLEPNWPHWRKRGFVVQKWAMDNEQQS